MAKSTTRIVFISAGKYTSSAKYTKYSVSDLQKLSNATAFVVSVTSNYSIYGTGSNGYSDLITDMMSQVDNITNSSINKPFYLGLPAINASDAYSTSMATTDYARMKTFVTNVYNNSYNSYISQGYSANAAGNNAFADTVSYIPVLKYNTYLLCYWNYSFFNSYFDNDSIMDLWNNCYGRAKTTYSTAKLGWDSCWQSIVLGTNKVTDYHRQSVHSPSNDWYSY